jgi:hypothetical protein
MRNKKKFFLVQFLILAGILLAFEIALRLMGYHPGDMKPKWLNFAPVDTLIVSNLFYTNNGGLLIANRNDPSHSEFINHEGFRSKEFSEIDTTKKKILFIGDSFTWGFSATPIKGNCFADIVANETNYEVINLGIPGTDPPQYSLLAEKYIPQLKPDLVLVMFFMGNDLMMYDRTIAPYKPLHHYTNAGAIYADMDGKHFATARAAYHYVTDERYYLLHPSNLLEKIIAKSALLSRLYSVRYRIIEKIRYEKVAKNAWLTKKYLKAIKEAADKYKVPVRFVLIPEIKEADKSAEEYTEKYADLLRDSVLKDYWLIPQKNEKSNFNDYPDAHLNNKGHRFYADYIKAFLKKNFDRP